LKATVTILEVKEKQHITNNRGSILTRLAFKAREGDKEYIYTTFSEKLMGLIQKGETLDINYDLKERKSGQGAFFDRSVTQAEKHRGTIRGRAVAFKANTEVQTAVKAVTELQIAGLEVSDDLIDARNNWLRQILTGMRETVSGSEGRSEPVPRRDSSIEMKTVGDLLTACHKRWNMNRTQVLGELGVADLKSLDTPAALLSAFVRLQKVKENLK
jgi:hypothetical protein